MNKFLFMSGRGESLGLAFRLRSEGCDVTAWIYQGDYKQNYTGLLKKTKRWSEVFDADTTVVFDSMGAGKTADRLRSQGHAVLGASVFADALSRDPEMAATLVSGYGLDPVKDGCEIEGWFDGQQFRSFFKYYARYRAMPGELGGKANSTSLVFAKHVEDDPRIADLKRFEPMLRQHEIHGPMSLNAQNEIHIGLRFDHLFAMLELCTLPIGSWLSAFAMQREPIMVFEKGWACALRVSTPPWPLERYGKDGLEVRGLTAADRPHVYFHNVMFDEHGRILTTGADGSVVTLTGDVDSVVKLAQRVQLQDKQYRNDIEEVLSAVENQGNPTTSNSSVDGSSSDSVRASEQGPSAGGGA